MTHREIKNLSDAELKKLWFEAETDSTSEFAFIMEINERAEKAEKA